MKEFHRGSVQDKPGKVNEPEKEKRKQSGRRQEMAEDGDRDTVEILQIT